MSDVVGASQHNRTANVGTGLLVAGLAGAASLQPSISHRSLKQQAIVTGASMGIGFLVGSTSGAAVDRLSGSLPGGSAGSYAAMTGAGAGLVLAATRLGAAGSIPALRGVAHTLGFALAVSGAAGLGLSATHQADVALRPKQGEAGNSVVGRNAVSIAAGAAAVVGAGLLFHQPARFVGESSRVVAAAQRAYAVAPAELVAAAKGGPGAPFIAAPKLLATVSGGAGSGLRFEDLGTHGQEFAREAVSGADIQRVMGSGIDPIRAYSSLKSAPTMEGRVDALIADADRLGAFDGSRKRILLATATGSGFIDPPSVQAAEYVARGKIATLAIQYDNEPSVIAQLRGRTRLGAEETAMLIDKVNARIAQMPGKLHKPELSLFGESLGALAQHQSFGASSPADLVEKHIASSLWVGVPNESKFEARAIAALGTSRNPGEMRAFNSIEDVEKLTPAERASLRHVVVSHDNDAVHVLNKKTMFFERPDFLPVRNRPAGVPVNERYIPVITPLQSIVDLLNGTHPVPGKFEAFSHDYRADLPEFARVAFGSNTPGTANFVSDQQLQLVTNDLVNRELARTALGNQAEAAKAALPK